MQNKLYVWGWNNCGQLGLGDTTNRLTPIQVTYNYLNFEQIDSNNYNSPYTVGIDVNNDLYGWGYNTPDLFMLGNTSNVLTPVKLAFTGQKLVAQGENSIYVIDVNNDLYGWGNNSTAQIGLGYTSTSITVPTQIGVKKWKQITSGMDYSYTLAIDEFDNLYQWGNNGTYGGLGFGDKLTKLLPEQIGVSTWKQIQQGSGSIHGLDSNDNLYSWGNNNYGQLGLGNSINQSIPTKVGTTCWKNIFTKVNKVLTIKQDDNTIYSFGYEFTNYPSVVSEITQQIGAQQLHTSALVLDSNNDVYGWKSNNRGQLGLGDTTSRLTPTKKNNFKATKLFAGQHSVYSLKFEMLTYQNIYKIILSKTIPATITSTFKLFKNIINIIKPNYCTLEYILQFESDQLEFNTSYNTIKLKSDMNVTQDFKLIKNIDYNQINSLFKLTTNKQIEPNQTYIIQQESDQLEFLSSFNIIITNNKLYNAIFNTVINKSFTNLNTSYNIVSTITKNFSTSYILQMSLENLSYSTNYNIIKSKSLPIITNYLLINTNSLEHSSIFNTIINKSFTNLNTNYNIYHLVTNEYTLSYTIDGTFTRIKNYNLQYSLSDYTGSILFGFDIEYIIIQCPKLKRYWY